MKVWIVYGDGGCEGCTEPLKAFSTEEKARQYIEGQKYETYLGMDVDAPQGVDLLTSG